MAPGMGQRACDCTGWGHGTQAAARQRHQEDQGATTSVVYYRALPFLLCFSPEVSPIHPDIGSQHTFAQRLLTGTC